MKHLELYEDFSPFKFLKKKNKIYNPISEIDPYGEENWNYGLNIIESEKSLIPRNYFMRTYSNDYNSIWYQGIPIYMWVKKNKYIFLGGYTYPKYPRSPISDYQISKKLKHNPKKVKLIYNFQPPNHLNDWEWKKFEKEFLTQYREDEMRWDDWLIKNFL